MAFWQEFDLSIYQKKLAFVTLDRFLSTKPLHQQIKILNTMLFDILISRNKRSQRDFQISYTKIIKEIQNKIKIKKAALEWCIAHFQ